MWMQRVIDELIAQHTMDVTSWASMVWLELASLVRLFGVEISVERIRPWTECRRLAPRRFLVAKLVRANSAAAGADFIFSFFFSSSSFRTPAHGARLLRRQKSACLTPHSQKSWIEFTYR